MAAGGGRFEDVLSGLAPGLAAGNISIGDQSGSEITIESDDNSTRESISFTSSTGKLSSLNSSQDWTVTFKKGNFNGKENKYYKYLIFKTVEGQHFRNAEAPPALYQKIVEEDDWYRRRKCKLEMGLLALCIKWGKEEHRIIQKYDGQQYDEMTRDFTGELASGSSEISSSTSGMEKLSFLPTCTSSFTDDKQRRMEGKLIKLYNSMHATIKKYQKGTEMPAKDLIPIPPSCINFLHASLLSLKPSYAEEPFTMYGIELRCVDGLEKIYDIEGLSKEHFIVRENLTVGDLATRVADFLKSVLEFKSNERQHFMNTLTMNLAAFAEEEREKWKDFISEMDESSPAAFNLFLQLVMLAQDNAHTGGTTTEAQLYQFLTAYINLDDKESFCNVSSSSKSLQQFRWIPGEDSVGRKCTTYLEFVLKSGKRKVDLLNFSKKKEEDIKADIETSVPIIVTYTQQNPWSPHSLVEINVDDDMMVDIEGSLAIKSVLLFQVWKEVFSNAVFTNHQEHGNRNKVLQSCTIISNKWARSCVLCINMDKYDVLMGFNDAETTVNWIRNGAQKKEFRNWCRLYIDENKTHVLDIHKELKFTASNFCMCF